MDSLNHYNQSDVIQVLNSISVYLDALLNIDNPYCEGTGNEIYPPELQLNKANFIYIYFFSSGVSNIFGPQRSPSSGSLLNL